MNPAHYFYQIQRKQVNGVQRIYRKQVSILGQNIELEKKH